MTVSASQRNLIVAAALVVGTAVLATTDLPARGLWPPLVALAVILHRLPVGIAVWWLTSRALGRRGGIAAFERRRLQGLAEIYTALLDDKPGKAIKKKRRPAPRRRRR